jgi:hypothetical protein
LNPCFSESPVVYTIHSEIIPVTVVSFIHTKEISDSPPPVVGLGLLTGIGTGSAGLGVSISQFQKLSTALKESLNDIALQISAIQDQIDSLAAMVQQNRKRLDLFTGEKGRPCLFLGEDCCFFTNKSGIVRHGVKKLKDRAQQLTSSQSTNILSSLYPWLIPLAVPFILFCLALMFLPCLINILLRFLQECITAIFLGYLVRTI